MPRVTTSLWIDADPIRVYDVCQAPPDPLLPPGGPRLIVLDQPGEVGSRYRWEFRRLALHSRVDSRVTVAVPGSRLALQGTAGWEMEADLTLEPERGGTRLLFRMQYRFPFPLKWLLPGGLIRLGIWHALRRVKAVAEESLPEEALTTT